MIWYSTDGNLGMIPEFFSEDDPRPAAEQLDENYAHGGGFMDYGKGKWSLDPKTMVLTYPGDPPMAPRSWSQLREEKLFLYDCSQLLILQPDGTFAVTRVD
jgi:hypothetical protein